MKRLLLLVAWLVCFASTSAALAAEARILIVVGPSDHPPGTHEVAAGGRLLKHCLENVTNLPGIKVDLVEQWPDQKLRDAANSVVFLGDTFPPNRLPNPSQNLRDLDEMMRRGCGIVCVHYATGLLGEDVPASGDHPLLRWAGGYFANRSCPHHESFAKIFPSATIQPRLRSTRCGAAARPSRCMTNLYTQLLWSRWQPTGKQCHHPGLVDATT